MNIAPPCPDLTFDDAAHEYRYQGSRVPSVTQVLDCLQDLSHIPAARLARKSAIGTAVHRACELYLLGDLDQDSVHELIRPYLDQFIRFLKVGGFVPYLTERRVFSARYRYAGTLDLFGLLNQRKALIDIKTACQMSPVYGPQTAAYAAALEEETGLITEDRYVLKITPESFELIPQNERTDINVFHAALAVRTWAARHKINLEKAA